MKMFRQFDIYQRYTFEYAGVVMHGHLIHLILYNLSPKNKIQDHCH